MSPNTTAAAGVGGGGEVEQARRRCAALRELISQPLPTSKISPPCRLTLLRLLDAELRFLSRHLPPTHAPLSPNVGYLSSVLRVILHPSVRNVSRVCKPVRLPSGPVHVDLVCTLSRSPAWIAVSDRNPAHISWSGPTAGPLRGLRARVDHLVSAARSAPPALRPASVVLVFASGIDNDAAEKLTSQFSAVEVDFGLFEELDDGWVGVGSVFERDRVFEIKIDSGGGDCVPIEGFLDDAVEEGLGKDAFGSLVSSLRGRDSGVEMVNFDTTALVAMVSGISNGGTERLLKAPEDEMRRRFKGNYEFVMQQVLSELHHPLLAKLKVIIAGKKGIICQSVYLEFKELVLMCGGPNEKLRAEQLVKHLLVVPDCPSERVMDLLTTRKIALKNKIVFGTGDYWHASTLTANMGFVRAISQTGMSLLTIEHSPRALTGD